ncbi:hypothetical protein LX36DRAFT_15777 [Colletotrichum falcatum]|nr:hypothetical protein LX36DRAFT_15777 [Colletotrichum falcatum]
MMRATMMECFPAVNKFCGAEMLRRIQDGPKPAVFHFLRAWTDRDGRRSMIIPTSAASLLTTPPSSSKAAHLWGGGGQCVFGNQAKEESPRLPPIPSAHYRSGGFEALSPSGYSPRCGPALVEHHGRPRECARALSGRSQGREGSGRIRFRAEPQDPSITKKITTGVAIGLIYEPHQAQRLIGWDGELP